MTRTEAQAFLDLPDRTRVKILRSMNHVERRDAMIAIAFALGEPRRLTTTEKEAA